MSKDYFEVDSKLRCLGCGTEWPLDQKYQHYCAECGHIWVDDVDLQIADSGVRDAAPRPVEHIFVCPCCAHDL